MNDMKLKELQKQESIKRMELLKLRHDVIKCFKEKDEIFKTESGGELQFITDEEAKQIKAFENEYGGMVYHTIKSYTQFSRFLIMFYVSKRPEEWRYDADALRTGRTRCFVVDLEDSNVYHEFEEITFKPLNSAIVFDYSMRNDF